MAGDPTELQRRTLLQMATGLAVGSQLGLNTASGAAIKPTATGQPGDFAFLSGNWKIKHQRLRENEWIRFEGEATVIGILAGIASVGQLRQWRGHLRL
jgi:hypothetical protein